VTRIGPPPLDGPGFRRHLDDLDLSVRMLSALIIDGIPRATAAFLEGEESMVTALRDDYRAVRAVPETIADAVTVDIARRAPVGSDLLFLVAVLRAAPALGRCLQLVDHVAARWTVGPALPADAATAFSEMARLTTSMWERAAQAWCESDPSAAERLYATDETLDRIVGDLPVILRRSELATPLAMEAVTVGRFYERLGDHAVDLAVRTRWHHPGR
jgi:phosphate transport system protein